MQAGMIFMKPIKIGERFLAAKRAGGSLAHFMNLLGGSGLLLCCLLVLVALPLYAQNFTGSVVGAVRNPSGAVVPGAKVTLTNTNNGFTCSAPTDSTGEYVIRNLEPSVYRLKVEAQGFKTYEQSGITLVVQQNAREDVTLEVGSMVQKVEVTALAEDWRPPQQLDQQLFQQREHGPCRTRPVYARYGPRGAAEYL